MILIQILLLAVGFFMLMKGADWFVEGSADIAIGNIVGSNIFNILFVIGTASIIAPVMYQSVFLVDGIIAVLAGVLLWVSVAKTKSLRKPWGIVMLLCYAGYLGYLLV